MALDLQITTNRAVESLQATERSIVSLEASLNRIGQTSASIDKAAASLNRLGQGMNSTGLGTIQLFATALDRLGRAADVSGITRSLDQLTRLNFSAVATNIQMVNSALAGLRVPPGVAAAIQMLERLAQAARAAFPAVQQLAASLNNIHVPQGLNQISQQLQRITQHAQQAAGGMNTFNSAGNAASQMLQTFGVTLGAVGFARFIRDSVEAVNTFGRFSAMMSSLQDSGARGVGQHFQFLQETARSSATSIEVLMDRYSRFVTAAEQSNIPLDDTQRMFRNFAEVFRVFGLSSQQSSRGFLALEQMLQKGTVSMEELRRQLGEIIPAFPALARSMGTSTSELSRMIQRGEVSSRVLIRLGESMRETYGAGLAQALNTPAAAFANMETAVFGLQRAFGETFTGQIVPAIRNLTDALSTDAFSQFGAAVGATVGVAFKLFIDGIGILVQGLGYLTQLLGTTAGYLAQFGSAIAAVAVAMGFDPGWLSWLQPLGPLLYGATAAVTALGVGILALGGAMRVASITAFLFSGALTTVSVAAAPIIWPLLLIGAAVGALIFAWQQYPEVGAAVTATFVALGSAVSAVWQWLVDLVKVGFDATVSAWNRAVELFNGAVNTATGAVSSLWDGVKSMGASVANIFNSIVSSVQSAISAINNLINALLRAIGLQGQVGGGAGTAGAGGDVSAGAFRYGGLSNSPLHRMNVPASMFIGAPQFAAGGVTGGGIPSILHDDEAVVPLSGGRSIPVKMKGGGEIMMLNSIWVSIRESNQLLAEISDHVIDIGVVFKTEMDRHLAAFQQLLDAITTGTTKICDELYKIQFTAAQSSMAYGGGMTGGVGMVPGTTARDKFLQDAKTNFGGRGGTLYEQDLRDMGIVSGETPSQMFLNDGDARNTIMMKTSGEMAHQPAQAVGAASTNKNDGSLISQLMGEKFGSYGSSYSPGGWGDTYSSPFPAASSPASSPAAAGPQAPIYGNGQGGNNSPYAYDWGSYQLYQRPRWDYVNVQTGQPLPDLGNNSLPLLGGGGNRPQFTNVPQYAEGGITPDSVLATVHPNEAVIPLSSGKVPVELSGQDALVARIEQLMEEKMAAPVVVAPSSAQQVPGGRTIVVNMYIQTPDASSFGKSQNQILHDMKTQLNRAEKTLGMADAGADDPTKRPV